MPRRDSVVPLADVLSMIACPVCHRSLQLASAGTHSEPSIVCEACGRRYPIVDGIPVLIPERAFP